MKKHVTRNKLQQNFAVLGPSPRRPRRHRVETLECRRLLAIDSAPTISTWQNPVVAADVNNDGIVTPHDALLVINEISRDGIHSLDNSAPRALVLGSSDLNATGTAKFVDVTGDGQLTPADVLQVIDYVNRLTATPAAQISVVAKDMNGDPISQIVAGTDFRLEMQAGDIYANPLSPLDVFAAYVDVQFPAGSVSYKPNSLTGKSLTFDSTFPNFRSGTLSDGLIDEAGAFTSNSASTGVGPSTIWTVTMTANTTGLITFKPNAADQLPNHNTLRWDDPNDPNDPTVADPNIDYPETPLDIIPPVGAAAPALRIDNISIPEGDVGPTIGKFTVTLEDSAYPVTIFYSTSNGSATAGSDYLAELSGTLSFAPHETSKTIDVTVNGDTLFEGSESFNVNLLFATNAIIADGLGVATIDDDDVFPTLSVGDAAVVEGDSGTTDLKFVVSLSPSSQTEVRVGFATQNNTAQAGLDYTAQAGVLTFAPGETSKTVIVPVIGDLLSETNETFFLNLSSPVGASLPDAQAIGTIFDNETQGFVITGATILEGDSGPQPMTFTISLSSPQGIQTTVAYATANGSATTADFDYEATNGTLTFAPGETSKDIVVNVTGDIKNEVNETFVVNLSNPVGFPINIGQATGTITNDDALPNLSIDSVIHDEGNAGTTDFVFTVTLSPASGQLVTVPFSTANGSATAGSDYVATSGILTFNIGETTKLITVVVNGDIAKELDEDFTVNLGPTSTANISGGAGIGTIKNDDGTPGLSIGNVVKNEGDSGPTSFTFDVTLTAASVQQITVVFGTSDLSATTGDGDYQAISGTITFAPGETSKPITVLVNGDTRNELDEQFVVTLSGATNSSISTPIATGTIQNDDPLPMLLIGNVSKNEGNVGPSTFAFPVSLSSISGQQVTVVFDTSDGNATTSDGDYVGTHGTLTFAPGQISKNINVTVTGDLKNEADETFTVTLSSPTNATAPAPTGTGTILNDDPLPSVSISDVSLTEGNSSTKDFVFNVTLSAVSDQPVTVQFATADNTAIASSGDYTAISGTLTFDPGQTSKPITVSVNGDTTFEPNETFNVNLSAVTHAVLSDPVGLGTILSDDGFPTLSVNDASIVEGNAGTVNMVFTVTLTSNSGTEITVGFATQDDTAQAGGDYSARSGVLTFSPGESTKQVIVPIIGDTLPEGDETFFLNLSSANGANLADAQGIGTIIDDDGFSISNAAVVEGNSGTRTMTFTVSLPAQLVQATVEYSTVNGTATVADNDYVPTSGTLTFAPGQTSKQVTVVINGDTTVEPDETFNLNLSSPTGSVISTVTGTGTIFDDDGSPTIDARFRLEAVDATNVPVTELNVNQNFTLNVYVQDVRPGHIPAGVFAAYLDILYNSTIVTATGPVSFAGSVYMNSVSGTTTTPGQIDEAGGADNINPLGPAEQFLFSVPMKAIASGREVFTGESADGVGHDVLFYDPASIVPLNHIDYGTLTIDVGSNSFQIGNATKSEGDAGTTNYTFTVTRFKPDPVQATVVFNTLDGTATIADNDYQATSNILTFTNDPSDTTRTITVVVNGDLKNEADEKFSVLLSNALGATIGQATGTGTIVNDDAPPTTSIADATGKEGTNLSFSVSLSAASGQTITVPYTTAAASGPNAATSGTDFTPTAGVLTFAPGVTVQNILVAAISDITSPEPDETFLVNLSAPSIGSLTDGSAVGIIKDAPPAGVRGFVYVDFNNDGIKQGNEPGIGGVKVTLVSADHSVTKTAFTNSQGLYQFLTLPPAKYTVTEIQPGFYLDGKDTQGTAPVDQVLNDQFVGIDLVNFSTATDFNFGEQGILGPFLAAALNRRIFFASDLDNPANGLGSGIVNVDLTQGDVWVSFDDGWDGLRKFEGSFNSANGNFTLKLYDLNPATNALRLLGTSHDASGKQLLSYVGTPGHTYFLQLTGTNTDASVRIIDTLSVVNAAVAEGNSGTNNRAITVKLSYAQSIPVIVTYATADGTAKNTFDYTATSGTLTFAVGETSRTVNVPVIGDTLDEDNETFALNLSNPNLVELDNGNGTVTITDDDQTPKLTINDVTVAEGNAGTSNAVFTVFLSAASGRQVTVVYTASAGTAKAGSDFTAVTGTLTFAAGDLAKNVVVPILGDAFVEGDETFNVVLSSAVSASILDAVGLGTISNDDAGPLLTSFMASSGSTSSGLLASSETSESSSTSPSTSSATTTPTSTTTTSSLLPRVSSTRNRSVTSATDAALEDEEDWSLVA